MSRTTQNLEYGWKFIRSDVSNGAARDLDDTGWESVRVPHDWAIEGPFDRANDIQHKAVLEDGDTVAKDLTGRTAGLPHVGTAWYRRSIEGAPHMKGKRLYIEFDGVMSHATVYVNGQKVGRWPYGYASFRFDITDQITIGGENLLAVRVDNKPCASRWYPGAGIYRHVRIVQVEPVHVAGWGTCITTPHISDSSADVNISTTIINHSDDTVDATLSTIIVNPDGERVTERESNVVLDDQASVEQTAKIPVPVRWDLDRPALYRATSRVIVDDEIVDRYETSFGIRSLNFDAEDGFFLNGQPRELKGVCMHHDLGALGAAVHRRAIERQVEKLQEMGCNAIRTAHNPPAPELLEICDEQGVLIIDEAFDEWRVSKVDNGYHTLFDEWAERDLRAFIRRDRNHPCVIMWSIGNEIGDQYVEDGSTTARWLTNICHDEDPTRPVTAGFNKPDEAIENGLATEVDIPGWNYATEKYEQYHRGHPDWIVYGSETESCCSSRGEYYFPVEKKSEQKQQSLHLTSYDMTGPSWRRLPDTEFRAQEDCPFMLGQFTWTGWDYLGEPTPYKKEWPSRSSYFGIIDLAGFPKDRFYLYKSHWADTETLHLLPHWTWHGKEGDNIPVYCYTNYDQAELFLNGQSLGLQRKDPTDELRRYRLKWEDVSYEPGELMVRAYDENDEPAAERVVRTAGTPTKLSVEPDRSRIQADGRDLCFCTVRIRDKNGNLCPQADNVVEFTVDGPAELVVVDNGDQTSLESFQGPRHAAFNGLCLAVVRSVRDRPGQVTIAATSTDLEEGDTHIHTIHEL